MNKDNKIVIILSKKKVLTGIIIALIAIFLITMIVLLSKSKNDDKKDNNSSSNVVEKNETKKEEAKDTTNKDTEKKETDTKKEEDKEDKKDDKKKDEEGDPNTSKFPDLTGLTLEEAIDKLNKAHIASDYTIQREDSELKKGVVVRTEPKAGTALPNEGKIQIVFYLSNGSKKFTLEDYEGKDFEQTKKYLDERGIVVKVEFKKPNYERENVPQNMIIGQSVAAGKELKAGDSITLYLAKGSVKYPDFTTGSYVLKDVQDFCNMYGIKLKVLYDEVTTYEDGLVFYQDGCLPGKEVVAGCEMTIKIAQH